MAYVRAIVTSASLRARLVLLALLTMLPLVGLLVAGAFSRRSDVLESARHRALGLVELGVEQQESVLREAKTLLTVLSRLPEITAADPERCRDLLHQTLGDHPHMAEFALIDAKGDVLCTNRSVRPNINMLHRPYIGRLLTPGAQGFDTSDLSVSKTSGISTVYVGLSLPPRPGDDKPSGVLVAGLNLEWMSGLAGKMAQGAGDIAVLLHVPEGTTLARYPDNALWVGRHVPNAPTVVAYNRRPQQAGTTDGEGPDGIRRIYGFAPLPGMDGVILAVGFNRAETLALANQRMATALGLALAAMLAAAVAAWLAARGMIIRPVGGIIETARRLGAGDLKARAAMAPWHAPELQLLAGTLNAMADGFASAQDRLAESEAGFRLLAENAGDMVARIGPDGVPRYVSPAGARLFGRPTDALTTVNLTNLMHPDDQARAKALQARLLSGAVEKTDFCYRIAHPDGQEMWVESALSAVRDPGTGAPDGYIAVVRDVTARHQVEAERAARADEMQVANTQLERLARHLARARDRAERASRAKSRFLAGMSHELRTPLNGILGYTQLLRLEGGLNPVQAGRVDAMLGAGAHLLQMINCVLDLSEIEANQVELHMAELNPWEVARACLDLVRPMAEAKALVLGLAVAPGTPRTITSDVTRLRQVLLNLLGNAVKFTDRGGVKLRLLAPGDGLFRIEVTDTGPGIPVEHQHRLFQDFERLQDETGGKVEGAGLGLAITSRLATLMGGRVGYEDNPDGGSVFWIELPVTATVTDAAPAALDAQPDEAPPAALHILVVDDIAMNRDIAGSFLTAAGHGVMFADGGAAAVELATITDFDVILMDVRMPEMDGLEAARRIRALDGPRGQVPIVALTAQAFADQIAACTAAGMGSHLAKPFAPHTLLDAVVRAVGTSPQGAAPAPQGATPAPQGVTPAPQSAMPALQGAMPAPQDAAPDTPARSPAPQPSAIGADLPVINAGTFERTCAFLPPDVAASYLQAIAERGEGLLQELRAPGLVLAGDRLADAAHALAGSTGMFGFERLSAMGRRFERAIQVGAPDAPDLANGLGNALEDTLAEVRNRMPAPA